MEALSLTEKIPLGGAPRVRAHAGIAFLTTFAFAAVGVGAARAMTTSFLPVLLDRINHAPALIGAVMLVNALAGFVVPLAVGIWSDRRPGGRLGPRVPFIVGGTLLTSGGLLAIALGTASSYAVLALAAAVTYTGLNATATAHRAIVAERFEDRRRPAATSAQELAMLVGGLAGIVAGGVLIDSSAWLLFLAAALALPLLAAPTVVTVLGRLGGRRETPSGPKSAAAHPRDLVTAMRERGPREVLVAQVLWVMAYAAVPAFFVLYADRVLDLGAGVASLLLAGFGLLTGAGMLAGGRTPPERVYPWLVAGAGLLGAGLLSAALFDNLALLVGPFAAAALGFGLVTALGFPYFARFIPDGQSGRYSGLYFSVRAIASAVALPLAGLLIAATGSYRAVLLQGGAALVALIPLARAQKAGEEDALEVARYPRPERVAAVIPCYNASDSLEEVARGTLRYADQVVLVDDGASPELAGRIDAVAAWPRAHLVRFDANSGKGNAVAAGAAALLDAGERPDAIVVVDCDGQHPPERIPDFVEAATLADVVIGNRRGDRRSMPRVRRLTNLVSSALLSVFVGRRIPDSQCGMRLYRTQALERVPLPAGRYEAETRHLKAAVKRGLHVAWVPIPAVYNGSPSSFRPLADSARVLAAITRSPGLEAAPGRRPLAHGLKRPSATFLQGWAVRLGSLVAATMALGALVPLLAPLDQRLFLSINSLGDGPEWLYQALDPHTRNYVLLSIAAVVAASFIRTRRALGAAVAVLVAALFSDFLLQSVYLLYDRPRPEEVLEGQALISHGRTWAHIASFPSGHMAVTAAIAAAGMAAAPALRTPLWIYIAAVAFTRVAFGAHFPLDVAAGTLFGYQVGRFSAALTHAVGLLPSTSAPGLALPAWWCRIRSRGCGMGAQVTEEARA